MQALKTQITADGKIAELLYVPSGIGKGLIKYEYGRIIGSNR